MNVDILNKQRYQIIYVMKKPKLPSHKSSIEDEKKKHVAHCWEYKCKHMDEGP